MQFTIPIPHAFPGTVIVVNAVTVIEAKAKAYRIHADASQANLQVLQANLQALQAKRKAPSLKLLAMRAKFDSDYAALSAPEKLQCDAFIAKQELIDGAPGCRDD
jgi:hypothetical protein